jgi:NAD-dependent deacetylase
MQSLVVFSGAGLSNESGIPTFRDAGGLWHNHRVEDVASRDAWRKDPRLVLDFYSERMKKALACQPNPAHQALARLQIRYRVVNITQNIDDLLERAGCTDVWHLHGDLLHRKCEWHHSIATAVDEPEFVCDFRAPHSEPVQFGEVCPTCGGQLRPDIVWFGEAVDMREDHLSSLVEQADLFLCVGTSAQVYPAAGLVQIFRSAPRKYFIDPKPPAGLPGYTCLAGPAGQELPRLAEQLLAG